MKQHENQSPASLNEALVEKWKKRFMFEKEYSEKCAEYLARRLSGAISHMQ